MPSFASPVAAVEGTSPPVPGGGGSSDGADGGGTQLWGGSYYNLYSKFLTLSTPLAHLCGLCNSRRGPTLYGSHGGMLPATRWPWRRRMCWVVVGRGSSVIVGIVGGRVATSEVKEMSRYGNGLLQQAKQSQNLLHIGHWRSAACVTVLIRYTYTYTYVRTYTVPLT